MHIYRLSINNLRFLLIWASLSQEYMKLNKQTDYALRILIYAAVEPRERLLSIQEVTTVYDFSRNHVMKIVQKLGQLGYLQTIRGKGGGFRIGQEPGDINIGQLVRDMENSLVLIDCEEPACRISPDCQLKHILAEAMNAFLAVLDSYTLADVVSNRNELIRLLAIA